jgi:hypothetical protein
VQEVNRSHQLELKALRDQCDELRQELLLKNDDITAAQVFFSTDFHLLPEIEMVSVNIPESSEEIELVLTL